MILGRTTDGAISASLLQAADILVTDFPPRRLAELELDYAHLLPLNPRLIAHLHQPLRPDGALPPLPKHRPYRLAHGRHRPRHTLQRRHRPGGGAASAGRWIPGGVPGGLDCSRSYHGGPLPPTYLWLGTDGGHIGHGGGGQHVAPSFCRLLLPTRSHRGHTAQERPRVGVPLQRRPHLHLPRAATTGGMA